MRPTVALVEARPETIVEDYRRVLTLAGLTDLAEGGPLALAVEAGSGSWFPGFISPPWQCAGVLQGIQPDQHGDFIADSGQGLTWAQLYPIARSGGRGRVNGRGWDRALAPFAVDMAQSSDWQPADMVGRMPEYFRNRGGGGNLVLPRGLDGRTTILLGVPAVEKGWPVRGATGLLAALLAARIKDPGQGGAMDMLASCLTVAREFLPRLAVVLDGVQWGAGRGGMGQRCIQRNILLAGSDPVACDAVAVALAGWDPGRVPWLVRLQGDNLGIADLDKIRIVGRSDLLDEPIGLDALTGPSASWVPGWGRVQHALWSFWRRRRLLRSYRRGPWGRLRESYRTGQMPGENS